MWTSKTDEEKKVLSWKDFSAAPSDLNVSMTAHVTSSLRRILEKFEESEFIKYLVVPSPIALSGFFHCTEAEIYNALQELHRQGYEYETAGSSGPVTLWDPLIRRKEARREEPTPWNVFYEALFNPVRRPVTG